MKAEPRELRARIRDALAARQPLADPLPAALTAEALISHLGPLAAAALDLGIHRHFEARAAAALDDETDRHLRLAHQWALIGDPALAHDHARRALAHALSAGSAEGCVAALVRLVDIAASLHRFGESLAAAIEAFRFPESRSMPGALEALCYNLSTALIRLSMDHYRPAVELAARGLQEALDQGHDAGLAIGLSHLSDACRNGLLRQEALTFAALAHDAAELGPVAPRASIEVTYASALYRAGRLEEALACCREAQELTTRFIDHENACRALQLKGTIHQARGEVSAALEAFHRAADLADQMGLRGIAAVAEMSLGHLYLDLNDPQTALSRLRRAIALKKRMGTFSFDGGEMLLVAICYRKMGKMGQAAKALATLAPLYAARGQDLMLAWCLGEMAQVGRELGDREEALHRLLQAVRILERHPGGVRRPLASLWLKLASVHRERQDREGAEEALRQVDEAWPDGPVGTLVPEYYLIRSWLAEPAGPEAVRRTLHLGLERLQRLRESLPYPVSRQMEGLAGAEALFDVLIGLEADRADAAQLYLLCQQARARRLIDLLSKSELRPPPQVDPELAERERSLLARLRAHLADLVDEPNPYAEAIDQAGYDSLQAELRALWTRMRDQAPEYARMRQGGASDLSRLMEALEVDGTGCP